MAKRLETSDINYSQPSPLESYQTLPAAEQQFIQLLSVIYQTIQTKTLLKCVTDLGIKDQNRKPLSIIQLDQWMQRFMRMGLVSGSTVKGYRCHVQLIEIASRDAVTQGNFDRMAKIVHARQPLNTSWGGGMIHFSKKEELLREIRIAFYQGDIDKVQGTWDNYIRYSYGRFISSLGEALMEILSNPFDASWLSQLDPRLYTEAVTAFLAHALQTLKPHPELFPALVQDCLNDHPGCTSAVRRHLVAHLMLRGDWDNVDRILAQYQTADPLLSALTQGHFSLLGGDYTAALQHYQQAMGFLKRQSKKRRLYFDDIEGLFYVLALLKEGSAPNLHQATLYASNQASSLTSALDGVYSMLELVAQVREGNVNLQKTLEASLQSFQRSSYPVQQVWCLIFIAWVSRDKVPAFSDTARKLCSSVETQGYHWLAMESAAFLAQCQTGPSPWGKKAQAFHQQRGIKPLVELLEPQETWQLRLKALIGLHTPPAVSDSSTENKERRISWFLKLYKNTYSLTPKEQKASAKGSWSRGRNIAVKRLKENTIEFDYLTAQDLQVCNCLEQEYRTSYYGSTSYVFNEMAIVALVGHPLVFWEDTPTVRVDIVQGEPEVRVRKVEEGWLNLELHPEIDMPGEQNLVIVKETPTRIVVFALKEEHHNIARILGNDNHLRVPTVAQEQVLSAISAISGLVTVQSDIGGDMAGAREVESIATPLVHLLPAGAGLKAALLVRPFGSGGPYYRPGRGGETVVADVEGERLQTTRSLAIEEQLSQGVRIACPHLNSELEQDGEWMVDEAEDCLELLTELQSLGDQVVVEWPEGQTFKIKKLVGGESFHLRIGQQKDWFAASGTLQVSDDLVLDLRQLVQLLQQSPGRFIAMDDGQFLALTDSFRKRLDELSAFAEVDGQGLRFHPLAAFALEDLMEEAGDVQADRAWQDHIQRLKDMEDLRPELPSTLQAELRDYQLEGFEWLARLAHWGVGACLADDMGLGKTLQALALVLTRAPAGPTLIVAPTSVCLNWLSEAQRFAPTLQGQYLGGGDRQKLLDDLQPFDMVVCSYGLLQQKDVGEMLAQVEWQTIVLDEAQAIKNFATKRSQAAMGLQGQFKILTTGTPIENHLGELWNLFRFINPGLLGSLDNFNQKFANPIERYQDRSARQKLKKLIQPFILRRTKTQVLQELPSRTEVTLQVELSREEMAFYEALRREALEKLADTSGANGPQHLQVLAEIMKLRRACCNSRLVLPTSPIPSAKLQLFGEVLEELLDNHHKALVFSQFVDHLHILRDYLDQKSVKYQYLDGSTPAKERQKRVTAFQAGEGEVFLISLKAGGTGLNLTAADYVIHMDPWWNPAVEDQASDRAHRMGQQRPVTVYRLVAQGTIEEKIVELHQQKRDLADSLLEGTEMSGKMSTEQLLGLLSES